MLFEQFDPDGSQTILLRSSQDSLDSELQGALKNLSESDQVQELAVVSPSPKEIVLKVHQERLPEVEELVDQGEAVISPLPDLLNARGAGSEFSPALVEQFQDEDLVARCAALADLKRLFSGPEKSSASAEQLGLITDPGLMSGGLRPRRRTPAVSGRPS